MADDKKLTQEELERLLHPPERAEPPRMREPYRPIPRSELEDWQPDMSRCTPRQCEVFEKLRVAHIEAIREAEQIIQTREAEHNWSALSQAELPKTIRLDTVELGRADVGRLRFLLLKGTAPLYADERYRAVRYVGVRFPCLDRHQVPPNEPVAEWVKLMRAALLEEFDEGLAAGVRRLELAIAQDFGARPWRPYFGSGVAGVEWLAGRDYALHKRFEVSCTFYDVESEQAAMVLMDALRKLGEFCKPPPCTLPVEELERRAREKAKLEEQERMVQEQQDEEYRRAQLEREEELRLAALQEEAERKQAKFDFDIADLVCNEP